MSVLVGVTDGVSVLVGVGVGVGDCGQLKLPDTSTSHKIGRAHV